MGTPARVAVALAASLLGANAGIFSAYTYTLEEKECSCNCCVREPRRPSEANGDSEYKCAMPPQNDERLANHGCTKLCTVVNDPIFKESAIVETNRFCFYHCQPTAGGKSSPVSAATASQGQSALFDGGSLVDAECVSMRPSMINRAVSGDHNGRDVAAPLSA
mmetsp:Transcript_73847/g.171287  ORF Transcript_73847/g.171287 Transcript_73847/m.171287 type:complete len:163 (-) Transcript_73847:16-504(-)